MSKFCVIVVVVCLLFAAQARAAHACEGVPNGAPAAHVVEDHDLTFDSGESLADDGVDESSSHGHGAGHCDLCAHGSVGAGAPYVMPLPVVTGCSDQPIGPYTSEPDSPPLGRPDKPPR